MPRAHAPRSNPLWAGRLARQAAHVWQSVGCAAAGACCAARLMIEAAVGGLAGISLVDCSVFELSFLFARQCSNSACYQIQVLKRMKRALLTTTTYSPHAAIRRRPHQAAIRRCTVGRPPPLPPSAWLWPAFSVHFFWQVRWSQPPTGTKDAAWVDATGGATTRATRRPQRRAPQSARCGASRRSCSALFCASVWRVGCTRPPTETISPERLAGPIERAAAGDASCFWRIPDTQDIRPADGDTERARNLASAARPPGDLDVPQGGSTQQELAERDEVLRDFSANYVPAAVVQVN